MGAVATIGRRPRFAPPPHARIDWSHPLAQGLTGLIVPCGGRPVELVRGLSPSSTASTVSVAATELGPAINLANASPAYVRYGADGGYDFTAKAVTCVLVAKRDATRADIRCGVYGVNVNDKRIVVALTQSTGNVTGVAKTSTATTVPADVTGVAAGKFTAMAVTWDGATVRTHAVGSTSTSSANSGNPLSASTGRFGIGDTNAFTQGGVVAIGGMWSRVLTTADLIELQNDPFQMLVW